MGVTREQVKEAFRRGHAATTVLLAPLWLKDHPGDLGVILDYAEMLYGMTRYEDAIRVYEDALGWIDDESDRWSVYNQIGRLYRYWGHLGLAEAWFRKAIEAEPDERASRIFLGACQARQGKLAEAEETHRAAAACPGTWLLDEAYLNLGLVLRGRGRFAEAADCFRKALELDSGYEEAAVALADVEAARAFADGRASA